MYIRVARITMAVPERQMILAAQRGQTDGYKYLMERYGRQVQLLVAQMVGDVRDVEELTQDVFVRAFRHRISPTSTPSEPRSRHGSAASPTTRP